jgi:hypothetical protein
VRQRKQQQQQQQQTSQRTIGGQCAQKWILPKRVNIVEKLHAIDLWQLKGEIACG